MAVPRLEGALGLEQCGRVELGQASEQRAVVEQAGVEEVRRQAPGLGRELAEPQYLGLDRKCNKLLAQIAHVLLLNVRKRVL